MELEYGKDTQFCLIGHSIGGWVLRSYIGEVLSEERALSLVSSMVTLGTPHQPPPSSSPLSRIDQTRGLLSYINDRFPAGSPLPSARVTCIAGSGTRVASTFGEILGAAAWDTEAGRSPLLEQVAWHVVLKNVPPLLTRMSNAYPSTYSTPLEWSCAAYLFAKCNRLEGVPRCLVETPIKTECGGRWWQPRRTWR